MAVVVIIATLSSYIQILSVESLGEGVKRIS
jgi:hypothetical protein